MFYSVENREYDIDGKNDYVDNDVVRRNQDSTETTSTSRTLSHDNEHFHIVDKIDGEADLDDLVKTMQELLIPKDICHDEKIYAENASNMNDYRERAYVDESDTSENLGGSSEGKEYDTEGSEYDNFPPLSGKSNRNKRYSAQRNLMTPNNRRSHDVIDSQIHKVPSNNPYGNPDDDSDHSGVVYSSHRRSRRYKECQNMEVASLDRNQQFIDHRLENDECIPLSTGDVLCSGTNQHQDPHHLLCCKREYAVGEFPGANGYDDHGCGRIISPGDHYAPEHDSIRYPRGSIRGRGLRSNYRNSRGGCLGHGKYIPRQTSLNPYMRGCRLHEPDYDVHYSVGDEVTGMSLNNIPNLPFRHNQKKTHFQHQRFRIGESIETQQRGNYCGGFESGGEKATEGANSFVRSKKVRPIGDREAMRSNPSSYGFVGNSSNLEAEYNLLDAIALYLQTPSDVSNNIVQMALLRRDDDNPISGAELAATGGDKLLVTYIIGSGLLDVTSGDRQVESVINSFIDETIVPGLLTSCGRAVDTKIPLSQVPMTSQCGEDGPVQSSPSTMPSSYRRNNFIHNNSDMHRAGLNGAMSSNWVNDGSRADKQRQRAELCSIFVSTYVDFDLRCSCIDPVAAEYLQTLFTVPFARVTPAQSRLMRRSGFEFVKLLHDFPHVNPTLKESIIENEMNYTGMWLPDHYHRGDSTSTRYALIRRFNSDQLGEACETNEYGASFEYSHLWCCFARIIIPSWNLSGHSDISPNDPSYFYHKLLWMPYQKLRMRSFWVNMIRRLQPLFTFIGLISMWFNIGILGLIAQYWYTSERTTLFKITLFTCLGSHCAIYLPFFIIITRMKSPVTAYGEYMSEFPSVYLKGIPVLPVLEVACFHSMIRQMFTTSRNKMVPTERPKFVPLVSNMSEQQKGGRKFSLDFGPVESNYVCINDNLTFSHDLYALFSLSFLFHSVGHSLIQLLLQSYLFRWGEKGNNVVESIQEDATFYGYYLLVYSSIICMVLAVIIYVSLISAFESVGRLGFAMFGNSMQPIEENCKEKYMLESRYSQLMTVFASIKSSSPQEARDNILKVDRCYEGGIVCSTFNESVSAAISLPSDSILVNSKLHDIDISECDGLLLLKRIEVQRQTYSVFSRFMALILLYLFVCNLFFLVVAVVNIGSCSTKMIIWISISSVIVLSNVVMFSLSLYYSNNMFKALRWSLLPLFCQIAFTIYYNLTLMDVERKTLPVNHTATNGTAFPSEDEDCRLFFLTGGVNVMVGYIGWGLLFGLLALCGIEKALLLYKYRK